MALEPSSRRARLSPKPETARRPAPIARASVLAALLAMQAGCVSLTPGQEARLADWQKFADRVTTHYHVSGVSFLVGTQSGPGLAPCDPAGS